MRPLSPAGAFVLALTMIRNNLNVGTLPLLSSARVRQETRNYIVNDNNQLVFVKFGAYSKKIFFTAQVNYHEENIYVVNIPRSRHGEPVCVAAKQKELRDYKNF